MPTPSPLPFGKMSEEEIMAVVEAEIADALAAVQQVMGELQAA